MQAYVELSPKYPPGQTCTQALLKGSAYVMISVGMQDVLHNPLNRLKLFAHFLHACRPVHSRQLSAHIEHIFLVLL